MKTYKIGKARSNLLTYISASALVLFLNLIDSRQGLVSKFDSLHGEDGLFPACYLYGSFIDCVLQDYRGWLHTPYMLYAYVIYIFPVQYWAIVKGFLIIINMILIVNTLLYLFIRLGFGQKISLVFSVLPFLLPVSHVISFSALGHGGEYWILIALLVAIIGKNLPIESTNYRFWPAPHALSILILGISLNRANGLFASVFILLLYYAHTQTDGRRSVKAVFINLFPFITFIFTTILLFSKINQNEARSRYPNLGLESGLNYINALIQIHPFIGITNQWPTYASTGQSSNFQIYSFILSVILTLLFVFVDLVYFRRISNLNVRILLRSLVYLSIYLALTTVALGEYAERNIAVIQIMMLYVIVILIHQFQNKFMMLFLSFYIISILPTLQTSDFSKDTFIWSVQMQETQAKCDEDELSRKNLYFGPRIGGGSNGEIIISCVDFKKLSKVKLH